jgi:hypothetical protein
MGLPPIPLKQSASLDRKIIKRHLKLGNSRSDFWMLSDLLLECLQDFLSTLNMRFCSRIWLGIAFVLRFHDHSPPVLSLLSFYASDGGRPRLLTARGQEKKRRVPRLRVLCEEPALGEVEGTGAPHSVLMHFGNGCVG